MVTGAPAVTIHTVRVGERPVPFRLPFRFGAVTVTQAPQAFVQLTVREAATGRQATGAGAELMVPKWFDKAPALTPAETVDQLRRSLGTAAGLAEGDLGRGTVAALVRRLEQGQRHALPALPGLAAQFGPALVTRALVDAVCRLLDLPFAQLVRTNRIGLTAGLLPHDLRGADVDGFLADLRPLDRIAVRHTVGLADPITEAEVTDDPGDGLPVSLEAVIDGYGHRDFKLKLSGDAAADVDRLNAVATVLDRLPDYRVTLDGNEQFADAAAADEALHRLAAEPRLQRLVAGTRYLEQPIARAAALDTPLGPLADRLPVIIDESDADEDAFVRARALGYRGVSSKACKGVLRSLVNALRVRVWGGGVFLSAEDLTTQAGLGLQQDLALVALLGLGQGERNGHHYVGGMAGAPAAEQAAFAAAHPDLYRRDAGPDLYRRDPGPDLYRRDAGGRLRLRIEDGAVSVRSLDVVGFGSAVLPDPEAIAPLATPATNFGSD